MISESLLACQCLAITCHGDDILINVLRPRTRRRPPLLLVDAQSVQTRRFVLPPQIQPRDHIRTQ